jgi:hypothetical protein
MMREVADRRKRPHQLPPRAKYAVEVEQSGKATNRKSTEPGGGSHHSDGTA